MCTQHTNSVDTCEKINTLVGKDIVTCQKIKAWSSNVPGPHYWMAAATSTDPPERCTQYAQAFKAALTGGVTETDLHQTHVVCYKGTAGTSWLRSDSCADVAAHANCTAPG